MPYIKEMRYLAMVLPQNSIDLFVPICDYCINLFMGILQRSKASSKSFQLHSIGVADFCYLHYTVKCSGCISFPQGNRNPVYKRMVVLLSQRQDTIVSSLSIQAI